MAEEIRIISNTTPLINFAEINKLRILADLFGEIMIPRAVAQELRAKRQVSASYNGKPLAEMNRSAVSPLPLRERVRVRGKEELEPGMSTERKTAGRKSSRQAGGSIAT